MIHEEAFHPFVMALFHSASPLGALCEQHGPKNILTPLADVSFQPASIAIR
jgi:hypothetical protein